MNDFKKEYQVIKPEIDSAIGTMLASGWYILGEESRKFEKNFADYIGSKYAIGVANGLEALQISLMALGIGTGDEVITVSNSAVATSLAITNTGATPVFVDVDEYYHMDLAAVEAAITPKTKAIMPVHLFGQLIDITGLQELAKTHNLHIVEDACQAHGAALNGKKAGSFGILGCFSFYPTKNLGGYGDGGAITTDSEELYEQCVMLRNYGQKTRYIHLIKGMNSRLDEIQAAILNVKLTHLNIFVANRNKVAAMYFDLLKDVRQITLPKIRENHTHAFHLFAILAENRDGLMKYLNDKGVQSLVHYPIPIHKQQCYAEFNDIKLERTERLADSLLSIPIHPFMDESEAKLVAEKIKEFYNK
jgi:dTDP-4-amino-4,6-dideoxygalactose transaminase